MKYGDLTLIHNDSRNPGRIRLATGEGRDTLCDMSVHEAAEFSERLREAVRMSGYDMVARRRPRR